MSVAGVMLLASLSCASPTEPAVAGAWGGTEASLVLTTSGGALSYQCGEGTIDSAWALAPDGSFAASGLHYFGGGPVPAQGRPPHPARYQGQVSGNRLTLTVTLTDGGQVLGPFHFTRNGPVVHELCL